MRRNSILESNIVQTIGSAGESLAAGAVFTLPALFLWAADGQMDEPGILEITLIALIGGLLGVFFMVPLRNALIVKEHGVLPYPEGTACAEVLLAGEKGGSSASTVFAGMGFAALAKFIIDGLKLVSGEISGHVKGFAGEIGTMVSPALMSVGYICGARISSYMFSGGVLSWLVIIPLIVMFGGDAVVYPSEMSISALYAQSGAAGIRANYVCYIGAGALAAGGIISLVKSLPTIVKTFGGAMKGLKSSVSVSDQRTDKGLNFGVVIGAVAVLTLLVWLVPAIPVSLLGAVIIVVFGFFFATVSSRMVGLVGSSNNPVSGMAIATLLVSTLLLKLTGSSGVVGMSSAIAICSIICIVSAIAGDTSQDLKTGFLLGATPKKQQIAEIIGVVAAALTIGGTLYLLYTAYGFGEGTALEAPQAALMKLITEGVMGGNLPWGLVFIGVFIAVAAEIIGIPVLPFAIGVYLPVQMSACIMVGGLVRLALDKLKRGDEEKKEIANDGVLFCSGMIAGEGLVGVLLAALTIFGLDSVLDLSKYIPSVVSNVGGLVLLGIIALTLLKFSLWKKREKAQ